MAHELHIENGKASMMYVDEPPWHGLGTRLERPATAAEAIKAANLDWDVVKKPVMAFGGKVSHPISDRFAVLRQDWFGQPKPIFGIVGQGYTPLQNRDAFACFDSIVGRGAAVYHTAGALGDGERVWVLAKLPSDIRVIGDDIAHKFLLLSNSHDGSSAVQIKFTPIRVVCQNTLSMALNQGRSLRVPHVKNLRVRMQQVADMLGIIGRQFERIEVAFKAMAEFKLNSERLEAYLKAVFPDPEDVENENARVKAEQSRLLTKFLFEHGKGTELSGVRGSLWAAYNGVAELTDHRQPAGQDAAKMMNRRLDSVWFGDGYSAKVRAYAEACKLMAR